MFMLCVTEVVMLLWRSVVVCNEFEHINAMKTDPLAKI